MADRYQAYPEYKDSGVEWLGDLPAHWGVKKLKYLIKKLDSGVSVNADSEPANSNEIGVLKTSCVYTKAFRSEENKKVIEEELKRVSCRVKKGQLIISRMNTPELVGACAPVLHEYDNLYLPDRLWQTEFYSAGDHDAHYVHSVSLLQGFRDQIKMVAAGTSSSMQNIAKEDFLGIYIPHPSAREKQHIRQFLDHETAKIDTLIEEQQSLIRLLKEKRQAVISHAVTKGLNPNAPMKDSGVEWLGEVPGHWGVSALGYYSNLNTGATPERSQSRYWLGDIPWIKTGEVKYDTIYKTEECISEEALQESSVQLSPPGTLLMAMYGQGVTRGRVAILGVSATYNQACVAISPNKHVSSEFLRFYFMAAYHAIRDGGNETSQMNLNADIVGKFKVTIPLKKEQADIVAFLERELVQYDVLIEEANTAIELSKERRTALISAAVTGKIDVRHWAAPATEQKQEAVEDM
ncbi:MAG: hypothetical protein B0D91_13995 [Oceanospirillales bacterium LUC14_002_19_P2]|nr:MAG: hypothetical protein B0D91_13995 [Oceanospirillales bacterium LUC14_002_19_P2]